MRYFQHRGAPQEHRKFERVLSLDIETWSSYDLKKCGLHKYTSAKDAEVMLLAYAFDNDPVRCIDMANFDDLPLEVYEALPSARILKRSWNAQFEFRHMEDVLHLPVIQDQWECTMIRAANLSLPMGLAGAAQALGAPFQKDHQGAALIKYFCIPCAPTKANGYRTRNYSYHYPEKWEMFKKYCIRDVQVERSIAQRMDVVDHRSPFEKKLYFLDQKINAKGVRVNTDLVDNAIRINEQFRQERIDEAKIITGLDKPTSTKKLKEWLNAEMEDLDEEIETLRKEDVLKLMKIKSSAAVTRVLEIRQQLGKSSVSKYLAMRNGCMRDERVRGLFQFYGASRTGRWAGRMVQMQNLPRNEMKLLEYARNLVLAGDKDDLEMMYDNIPYVLSQLIRTAFIPAEGKKFVVLDYSAIEAVILAWLADEKWRLDVFRTHGKIYEASASMMFGIPLEVIIAGVERHDSIYEELRQRGKVAELALGYGGSTGAITTMDLKKKIKEADKKPLVDRWRAASPAIVAYWRKVNDAAIHTIKTGQESYIGKGIYMLMDRGIFFIVLPSGRRLAYLKPRIGTNRFGGESVVYIGQNQKTSKWEDLETYGGKLVENIDQAIARDLLAHGMFNINEAGYDIVAHVHDEVINEVPIGMECLNHIGDLMTDLPEWAMELPLKVKGFETMYYKKD